MSIVPLVDVNIAVYNHAPYLRKTLDSVLSQVTNFPFRILIGDDCSTDGSIDILKEYEGKFPDKISVTYQKVNLGLNTLERSAIIVLRKSTAKYIALLDGDDFWTDPLKLQKQTDFLEANEDFSFCFTGVDIIDEIGLERPNCFPQLYKEEFTIEDVILTEKVFIPTATILFRNILPQPFPIETVIGDNAIFLLLADKGKARFINEKTAMYRQHSKGFSKSDHFVNNENKISFILHEEANRYFNYKYDLIFRKRLLALSKTILIYGSRNMKKAEKVKHVNTYLPKYIKYSESINLKEIFYYIAVLFFPAYFKDKKSRLNMKIWAFPSFYPYEAAGKKWVGIFAHRQYKGLIENGADLEVIMPIPWYPPFPFSQLFSEWKHYAALNYPNKRTHDGIIVHHPRISNMRPNRFVKKSYAERTIDAIINFFKRNNIVLNPAHDIFYSQWLPDSYLVQEAARRLGVKSAILGIGDDIIIYPHQKQACFEVFKKTWVEADNRFVVADYLGKEANKIAGTVMPYDTIFMGVAHDFFKPGLEEDILRTKKAYNIPTDKIIILTIGTAIKRKGWLDLFDAEEKIKRINNDFFQVAIHGGTPEFDLNEEAEKRGLKDNFLDLGEISPDIMNRLFNAADIFCLPSHWEGMANVNIEAMSSGLPVITTDVCGHPELIRNGETGIMIPPKRPDMLADALMQLITDAGKRKELGDNARKFIVNEWGSFTYNASKLYKVLTTLIQAQ